MAEFIHNAWNGWAGYTGNGKLPALLLAVLLYLWFGRKQKEQRALLMYTSFMTICCILPVTAAVLMMYQTKFYNYEWIWSLVPLTAVTAYGMTLFWTEYRAENAGQWKKLVPVALLVAAVFMFCGSMGRQVWDREAQKAERIKAYAVLEQLSNRYPGGQLCLWAPREIMEYAREKDASIRLPYGRNIWDGFLNAYAYDVYREDIVTLERWMENLGTEGTADLEIVLETDLPEETSQTSMADNFGKTKKVVTLEECMGMALEQGVNCILVTAEAQPETMERMEAALGTEAERLDDFYLFFTGEEEIYGRTD